ncbi:TPA: excalibur calcium-binding domain-containing protein [Stenotrophomonas maltophilia]|nr:excalibur calcium-binding domain-containing protein [Stenotrophomonas maltophilia]
MGGSDDVCGGTNGTAERDALISPHWRGALGRMISSPVTSLRDPGYGPHLDRDNDGVGCEPYRGRR